MKGYLWSRTQILLEWRIYERKESRGTYTFLDRDDLYDVNEEYKFVEKVS